MLANSSIIWSTVNSDLTIAGAPLKLNMSARARRMRLRVDPRTRTVLLTVPRRVAQRKALAWAADQQAWIEAALAGIPAPVRIAPGALIPFRGAPHLIDWSRARPRRVVLEPGRIVAGGPEDMIEARVLRWLRREALNLLDKETREIAAAAGVMVPRIGVGDPVSRWGSCSSSGAIRYSWRLILAPDFVRRATVAHEVAHRVHMNHGREFHALVEELLGEDPGKARIWLRREGAALHRVGCAPA